jgi:hypothetical protein
VNAHERRRDWDREQVAKGDGLNHWLQERNVPFSAQAVNDPTPFLL